ncbi:MAG: hypothetical protein H8E85_04650 [Candidatus Marinimicrobia bacterium]|nr:hypothetical protein [Candidatus Neomarinimicrobiota bacterium]
MIKRIPKLFYYFIFILSFLFGDTGGGKLSLILIGNVGSFSPVVNNFTTIYGNSNYNLRGGLGLGWNKSFFLIKYNQFNAEGESIVKSIDLTGSATWNQEFISLGFRYYPEKNYYSEVGIILGKVKETITTSVPILTDLNTDFSTNQNQGGYFLYGFNFPFILGIVINGEIEYDLIYLKPYKNNRNDNLNLGGPMINVGASIVF